VTGSSAEPLQKNHAYKCLDKLIIAETECSKLSMSSGQIRVLKYTRRVDYYLEDISKDDMLSQYSPQAS